MKNIEKENFTTEQKVVTHFADQLIGTVRELKQNGDNTKQPLILLGVMRECENNKGYEPDFVKINSEVVNKVRKDFGYDSDYENLIVTMACENLKDKALFYFLITDKPSENEMVFLIAFDDKSSNTLGVTAYKERYINLKDKTMLIETDNSEQEVKKLIATSTAHNFIKAIAKRV